MRGKFEGPSFPLPSLPLFRLTKDSRPGSGLESLITSWSGFSASSSNLGHASPAFRWPFPLTSIDWEWEWHLAGSLSSDQWIAVRSIHLQELLAMMNFRLCDCCCCCTDIICCCWLFFCPIFIGSGGGDVGEVV